MNEMKNEEKTAAATVTNERDAFEAWAQRYDLVAEPNYSEATKVDCWAAWKARAALAATPAATESREELAHRLIGEVKTADSIATAICQRVAELGDLSSPEDWPEAMLVTGDELHLIAREAVIEAQETSAAAAPVAGKSDTHGMNLGQRILHVGGRENAQTYIEFGSIGAVGLLVSQVLRDLPGGAPGFEADFGSAARRYTKDQQDRALLAGVSAPAAVAVPDGWREKFAADVYADLAAADNQDVPLEEYPARILKVLDSIVGPRHPVVIKWRNDAIRNCIAIAYKYCRDPESHKYLKQDLEAMLTTEPAPQAQADARDAVWLQPADMAALERFAETTDDDQSYDIGKDSVQRLSSFGCLKNCGFGRYEITSFGSYLLNDWERARILPFTTQADRDAAHRAAIAAAKEQK